MILEEKTTDFVTITADVVAAYVANNSVASGDIPSLIRSIHDSFTHLGKTQVEVPAVLQPAVSVKKSVTPDFIYCLEDGKKFRSLRRHLKATYNLTPEEYRAKWGLPNDYPMVAPNYAAQRSQLAKSMGLGSKRSKAGGKRAAAG